MSLPLPAADLPLLTVNRGAGPRAGLDQAVARAEFLLRVSRTVSSLQNPERGLEALIGLLLEDLVDVAQVAVRSGTMVLVCTGVRGRPVTCTSHSTAPDSAAGFESLIPRGPHQDLDLPAGAEERRIALRSLIADDAATAAERLQVQHLVALPLTTRGQAFGRMLLGLGGHRDFAGSHAFLEDLADRIAVGIDATLVVAESRRVARVLRRSLAPVTIREAPRLRIATYHREAQQFEHLSGDFLDSFGSDDDLVVLCGDVEGKGVEAAVHARRIRNTVRAAALVDPTPAAMLDLTNRVLVAEAEGSAEPLATAVCARIRPTGDHWDLTLANAGHPPGYLVRADGTVEELQAEGAALGLAEDTDYADTTAVIGALDTVVLYTDGVTEARGTHDLFGEERLRGLLRHLGGIPARAQVEAVAVAVSDHVADRPSDDIAIIAIQRPEPA